MADIVNPHAIAFSEDTIRPMAEKIRGLKAEIDDAMIAWFAGINTVIGSSVDDNILDGRESQGVSRLTGDDITGLIVVMQSIQTTLNGAGIAARVQKPCVRPLRAG